MARQTRAERKAEEARILAEMDAAMGKSSPTADTETEKQGGTYSSSTETIHCKRCKSVMEQGVCPVCGFRVYTPMDEGKRKKIRLIVGGICVVVFLAAFLILRFA